MNNSACCENSQSPKDQPGGCYCVDPAKVAPVLLTCARNVECVEAFVQSYLLHLREALRPPTIVVDLTASNRLQAAYLRLLDRLTPAAIHVHPRRCEFSAYYSVQDAAYSALSCCWDEIGDAEHLLFLEDDVLFSSQFLTFLSRLELRENTGLYTFFLPGNGFGSGVVEPYRYYGTLCVLLPRRSVRLILDNRQEMERRYSPGYDQQWANFLGSAGLLICAAPQSYVQHMGIPSRIGSGRCTSNVFVP
jgi:hypothetical protein